MKAKNRSKCPVTYSLDVVGDKWSLLILRDIILQGKQFYQEFSRSEEGISTNILANRLEMLECSGILLKARDTVDRKRFVYSPTRKGLDLLPVIMAMVQWGAKYDATTGAPPDVIRKIEEDPVAYMDAIRARFNEPGAGPQG